LAGEIATNIWLPTSKALTAILKIRAEDFEVGVIIASVRGNTPFESRRKSCREWS
jgi:hypothetical protein